MKTFFSLFDTRLFTPRIPGPF